MNAQDLIQASMQYLLWLSPFALVFSVVACADQLISLVKKAAIASNRNSRGW